MCLDYQIVPWEERGKGGRCERGKGVRGGEREGGINGVMGRVREWEGKERGREGS